MFDELFRAKADAFKSTSQTIRSSRTIGRSAQNECEVLAPACSVVRESGNIKNSIARSYLFNSPGGIGSEGISQPRCGGKLYCVGFVASE